MNPHDRCAGAETGAEQWNARHTEDMLLAEIGKWIEAANFGTA